MRSVLLSFFLLVGCGDDGTTNTPDAAPNADAASDGSSGSRRCGERGTGTTTGTAAGVEVTPVRLAQQIGPIEGRYAIVLLEDAAAARCDTSRPANQVGEDVVMLFCELPAPKDYPFTTEQAFACPGANAFAIVENSNGNDIAESTGGMVTITDTDGECTAGTFTAQFDNETVTGMFDAYVCP